MIHYHGTPVSGSRAQAHKFLQGRHALVPFPRQDDMPLVADCCQSFVLDNGAFSVWKRGEQLDVAGYIKWVKEWYLHPAFDWALIPDVIDGTEEENDELIEQWKSEWHLRHSGVPVWHLHESIERLHNLAVNFRVVAIGSSGAFASVGTKDWWKRIDYAIGQITIDGGRPMCKLHGLRMLNPKVFTRLPLSSADSTNASVNCGAKKRFGYYPAPHAAVRANMIADRIEAHQSAHHLNTEVLTDDNLFDLHSSDSCC